MWEIESGKDFVQVTRCSFARLLDYFYKMCLLTRREKYTVCKIPFLGKDFVQVIRCSFARLLNNFYKTCLSTTLNEAREVYFV